VWLKQGAHRKGAKAETYLREQAEGGEKLAQLFHFQD
jgi:hypothetical protein